MNRKARAAVLAAVVAAAVAAFLIARPGGEREPVRTQTTATTPGRDGGATRPGPRAEPPVPRIIVRDGRPVGGVQDITVARGELVRFSVRSDAGEQVHVHGYDVVREVRPGRSTSFRFPARIEGVFEIELHPQHEQIAELRVTP